MAREGIPGCVGVVRWWVAADVCGADFAVTLD